MYGRNTTNNLFFNFWLLIKKENLENKGLILSTLIEKMLVIDNPRIIAIMKIEDLQYANSEKNGYDDNA